MSGNEAVDNRPVYHGERLSLSPKEANSPANRQTLAPEEYDSLLADQLFADYGDVPIRPDGQAITVHELYHLYGHQDQIYTGKWARKQAWQYHTMQSRSRSTSQTPQAPESRPANGESQPDEPTAAGIEGNASINGPDALVSLWSASTDTGVGWPDAQPAPDPDGATGWPSAQPRPDPATDELPDAAPLYLPDDWSEATLPVEDDPGIDVALEGGDIDDDDETDKLIFGGGKRAVAAVLAGGLALGTVVVGVGWEAAQTFGHHLTVAEHHYWVASGGDQELGQPRQAQTDTTRQLLAAPLPTTAPTVHTGREAPTPASYTVPAKGHHHKVVHHAASKSEAHHHQHDHHDNASPSQVHKRHHDERANSTAHQQHAKSSEHQAEHKQHRAKATDHRASTPGQHKGDHKADHHAPASHRHHLSHPAAHHHSQSDEHKSNHDSKASAHHSHAQHHNQPAKHRNHTAHQAGNHQSGHSHDQAQKAPHQQSSPRQAAHKQADHKKDDTKSNLQVTHHRAAAPSGHQESKRHSPNRPKQTTQHKVAHRAGVRLELRHHGEGIETPIRNYLRSHEQYRHDETTVRRLAQEVLQAKHLTWAQAHFLKLRFDFELRQHMLHEAEKDKDSTK